MLSVKLKKKTNSFNTKCSLNSDQDPYLSWPRPCVGALTSRGRASQLHFQFSFPYPPSLSHSRPFNFPFSFHYIQSNYLSYFILFQYRPILFASFRTLWRYSSLSSLFGSYLFPNFLKKSSFFISQSDFLWGLYIYIVFAASIYIYILRQNSINI